MEMIQAHNVNEIVNRCFALIVMANKMDSCMLDAFKMISCGNTVSSPCFYSIPKLCVCIRDREALLLISLK